MVILTMNVDRAVVYVIATLAMAVILAHKAEGAKYVVGDNLGWTIPPSGAADYYESWASNHNFTVDDSVVFKFKAGEQDLAVVTEEGFLRCNTSRPYLYWVFRRQTSINFRGSIPFVYYCTSTLAGHCSKGQKVVINVTAAATS